MAIDESFIREAQDHNIRVWSHEVDTPFAELAESAAREYMPYVKGNHIVDLGCGEGVATKVFLDNGFEVTAVDIHPEKLAMVDDRAKKLQLDMLEFLQQNNFTNVFCHHALEHTPQYQAVLKLLSKAKTCLIVVPALDTVHSVHYVAFADKKDIIPPKSNVVLNEQRERHTHEYWCITA